ncbi:ligand-binding protein SH3 [Anoxybacter fermentans]|uniref:Ligand-binding protein SH3 n=1 Tax=Anoxybacter fermentans TaxID=1323375 RepID=A0A3S9T255_9FIRM|nr:small multi-drug export protein [Anoxybacter fermentans]AZR74618.1 ligand-binding protein SH3 [Anoxybacter fermentans]
MHIFQFFNQYLSKELAVLLTAAFPFVELRGAIPLAMALGLPAYKAFILSVIGNILPIIPLLLLLDPITEFLSRRFRIFARFFDWLHARTIRKSDKVEKYGALGLIIFTAVPLPTTGAWTACVAAILFHISFYRAFFAISGGVLIAGILVTLISSGVF